MRSLNGLTVALKSALRSDNPSSRRLFRRIARISYAVFVPVFGMGFACVWYLILGPAWIRGHLVREWDSLRDTGMRNVVSPHRDGAARAEFADGSSLALERRELGAISGGIHGSRPARVFRGRGSVRGQKGPWAFRDTSRSGNDTK